jgi:hypothetical protein
VTAKNALIVADLATVAAPVTAKSGTATRSLATGTGTTATFYVYTTTTAIGEVTVTNQGTTFTYYVQGTAGKINKLAVSAPSSAPASTQQSITVTATDVFGNLVSGKSVSARVFGAQGTLDTTTATTGATLADFGVATFKLTLPATGRSLVEFSVTTASDAAVAVTGLDAPSVTPFAEVVVRDLAAELAKAIADLAAEKAAHDATKKAAADAALSASTAASASATALAAANAEIAKLKADAAIAKAASDKSIADLKKAFNTLATKWNKKNPKAKVTLVK